MTDFEIIGGGSVYLLYPKSTEAKDWVAEHIQENAQWFGNAVAVEHRYIGDIAAGIVADGLTVE